MKIDRTKKLPGDTLKFSIKKSLDEMIKDFFNLPSNIKYGEIKNGNRTRRNNKRNNSSSKRSNSSN